jgi:hypothetical protein
LNVFDVHKSVVSTIFHLLFWASPRFSDPCIPAANQVFNKLTAGQNQITASLAGRAKGLGLNMRTITNYPGPAWQGP